MTGGATDLQLLSRFEGGGSASIYWKTLEPTLQHGTGTQLANFRCKLTGTGTGARDCFGEKTNLKYRLHLEPDQEPRRSKTDRLRNND